MKTYTVTSNRMAGLNIGDTVSASELESLNIDALVSAGHLVAATAAPKIKIDKKEDN
jgi:hypothetical protein